MAFPERKVPVYKTENSIIDQEFSSIRERFDNEMKRMEQEMDRFRNEMATKSESLFNESSRTTQTSNYVTSSSGRNDHSNLVQRQTSNQLNSWLDDINSPLVQDTSDGKLLSFVSMSLSIYRRRSLLRPSIIDYRYKRNTKKKAKTRAYSANMKGNFCFLKA